MPTRTAPTVNGTPTYINVSFSLVDESGDIRSVTLRAASNVTNAQIEAMAAAIQAASNASVFAVVVSQSYEGAIAVANADPDAYPSVYDNVTLGLRNLSTGATQTAYIPAPVSDMIDGDSPIITDSLFTTWRDAALALVGSGYAARFTRFTERREINARQPAS